MFVNPDPFYVVSSTLEDFIVGMLSFGYPLDVSLVGNFDNEGRASRRDVDLPLHRDGEYSASLAEVQGGEYIEKPGINIVGLYCIRDSGERCVTLIDDQEIELKKGQALVFDNQKVLHGRKGPVGDRLLVRMWIRR